MNFCQDTIEIWKFVGTCVTVLKIVIPVILIVLGVISFGKAVIAADDKEIKSATNAFIKKFIAAVVIFFIPSLVKALFGLVDSFNDVSSDATICINCIASPSKCGE